MINGFNLKPWIVKTFKDKGFKKLTPIQEKSIPILLKHKNFIGVSATGTGKTLAFLMPILNNLDLTLGTQSIIIAPTRELARQIYSQVLEFKKNEAQLNAVLLVGGSEIEKQITNIQRKQPHIIIATVTRLKELMKQSIINFKDLRNIILDEADMLMDLGFAKDLDLIFEQLDHEDLQKMAWSATLHDLLVAKLSKYFTNCKTLKIGPSIYQNDKVKHHIIYSHDKVKILSLFTKTIDPYLCIIFTNKKADIKQIMQYLKDLNINAIALHGDLSSRDRTIAYKKIKNFEYQYVVASDLASRGLDFDGVSHIINWDLPDDPEWYVHRSGRCGRGNYTGDSYLFFDGEYEKKLIQLQDKGVVFDHITISKGQFNIKHYKLASKKPVIDEKINAAINKITHGGKQKVKPGYKKKQKDQIQKLKQKSKRKYLEKKIKEQRIEQYKKNNRSKYED